MAMDFENGRKFDLTHFHKLLFTHYCVTPGVCQYVDRVSYLTCLFRFPLPFLCEIRCYICVVRAIGLGFFSLNDLFLDSMVV